MTLQTTYTEVTPNKTRLDPNTAALENASDRTNPTGEAKHTIIDSTPQPVQASPTQNEDMNKLASAVKAEFERVEKLTGERPLSVTVPNADGKQTTIYRESQLNPGK